MPIYEFRCPVCQQSFEELLPVEQRNRAKKCSCGAIAERMMSKFSVGSQLESARSVPRAPKKSHTPKRTLVYIDRNHIDGGAKGFIRIGGDANILMSNSSFANLDNAIQVDGEAEINIRNTQFDNVRFPIKKGDPLKDNA